MAVLLRHAFLPICRKNMGRKRGEGRGKTAREGFKEREKEKNASTVAAKCENF